MLKNWKGKTSSQNKEKLAKCHACKHRMSAHQQILQQDKIEQHIFTAGWNHSRQQITSVTKEEWHLNKTEASYQIYINLKRKCLAKKWVECRTHQRCLCCWSEREAVHCCSRNLRSAPGAVGIHSHHTQTSDSSKNLTDSSGQQSDAHTHQEKSRKADSRKLVDLNASRSTRLDRCRLCVCVCVSASGCWW